MSLKILMLTYYLVYSSLVMKELPLQETFQSLALKTQNLVFTNAIVEPHCC